MQRSILTALAALLTATGAAAQTPPATGPYLVLETSPDVLSVLAVGSRSRTGDEGTLTWILLKNPPGANGAARTDLTVGVDCARKAMQQRTYAVRRIGGEVIDSGAAPRTDWMPLKAGRTDQAFLKLACEGTVDGEVKPDLDQLAADWRAAPAD